MFYHNLFPSVAAFARQMFPDTMRLTSRMLPLTHVVDLLQGLWFDEPWSQHLTEVVVMVVMLAVGVAVSTRTFRWE